MVDQRIFFRTSQNEEPHRWQWIPREMFVLYDIYAKKDKYKEFDRGRICGSIDENYRVITLILKKYGNLPLCLENYALFSLPPIFTTILYTYPLRCIIYLGELSGNIISNYHGTFIHIFIHGYYPIYQKNFSKPSFSLIHARKSVSKADTF